MIRVRLSVEPHSLGAAGCSVRFWVEPFDGAASETEIAMHADGGHTWTGHATQRAIGESQTFLYRLAMDTAFDTVWSLELVRNDDARVLLADSDFVAAGKTRLIGTCFAGIHDESHPDRESATCLIPFVRAQP